MTGKILARITAADAVDTGFVADTNADVLALALQLDGKILVGGKFTQVNGISRNFLVRVNTDGAVDSTFTPQVDNEVWTIKIQPDGKILIGGAFTTVNGQSRSGIARLLPAGTPDPNFNPGTGANLPVASIALQSDGRMVIGGMFSTFNGVGRSGIARLNPDGSLHQDFNPGAGVSRVGAVREPPLRWLRAPSPLWGRGGSDPGQARWPAPTGVALPPKSRRGVREPPPTVLGMGLGSFNFGN